MLSKGRSNEAPHPQPLSEKERGANRIVVTALTDNTQHKGIKKPFAKMVAKGPAPVPHPSSQPAGGGRIRAIR